MTWPKEVMSRIEEGLVCKHNTFHLYVIKDDSFAILFFPALLRPYTVICNICMKANDFARPHTLIILSPKLCSEFHSSGKVVVPSASSPFLPQRIS